MNGGGTTQEEKHAQQACMYCRFTAPCEAPQDEAQTAVRIQADGDLARGVQLTLQLYRATNCTDRCMRDLQQTG